MISATRALPQTQGVAIVPSLTRHPGRHRAAALVLSAVLSLATTSCAFGVHGLAFRTDDRLTITSPVARSHHQLPVTVSWQVHDFAVVGPGAGPSQGRRAGYFGVFVDQSPVPHDELLRYVARKDRTCRVSDGCPDATYLAARGIYSTTDTSIVLTQLTRPVAGTGTGHERHSVTVVLLDPTGRRIGESFFRVEFILDRKVLS